MQHDSLFAAGVGLPQWDCCAGVSVFWVNKNGEAMLQSLNMTSHLEDGRPY